MTVKLADGSKYIADRCVKRRIYIGTYNIDWTFYVLPLEGYDCILGLDWLTFHNPLVNWEKRTMKFRFQGKRHLLRSQLTDTKYDVAKDEWIDDSDHSMDLMSAPSFLNLLKREKHDQVYLCVVKPVTKKPR